MLKLENASVWALGRVLILVLVSADLSDTQQCLPFWPIAHHVLAAVQISAKMVIASAVVSDFVCSGSSVSVWSTMGASIAYNLKNVVFLMVWIWWQIPEIALALHAVWRAWFAGRLTGTLLGVSSMPSLPLSTEGQAHRLIEEATDKNNLGQMYIWWMPWL